MIKELTYKKKLRISNYISDILKIIYLVIEVVSIINLGKAFLQLFYENPSKIKFFIENLYNVFFN